MTPPDISKILELAEAYNPRLMFADVFTIRLWLNHGCDIERDILPAMRRTMQTNPHVRTFAYFTYAVERMHETRMKAVEASKPPEPDPDADHTRAKHIAWLRERFPAKVRCDALMREWMRAYEEKNGTVAIRTEV